jgi:DNA-directed RNA polymerase subunit RPC12/RpoP
MTRYFDINGDFTCVHCGNFVPAGIMAAGVNNRNHCPYCLWSRHLDLFRAGDRMAACKAPMQPVGLTLKRSRQKYASATSSELMLVHLCSECSKISINRIAADDVPEAILEVFDFSFTLSEQLHEQIRESEITLLGDESSNLVSRQLFGQAFNLETVVVSCS